MRTVSLLLGSPGANSHRSSVLVPCQIELQGSRRVPLREVVEWTPQGIARDVAHIPVSPELCLAIYDHMFHPNSLATHPERDELQMESSDAGLLLDKQPSETCIIASE